MTSEEVRSPGTDLGPRLVEGLFHVVKAVQLHTPNHPMARARADALTLMLANSDVLTLGFFAGGGFLNFSLIPLDVESFERLTVIARPFHDAGLNELRIERQVSADDLLAFGVAWAAGMVGDTHALHELVGKVTCRSLASPSRGDGAETIDGDVAVVAEASLAVEHLEKVLANPSASWTEQASAVRRLERLVIPRPEPAMVAFEHTRPTVARRAVAAGLLTGCLLSRIGAARGGMRAAVHTALLLGCAGFRERDGVTAQAAADQAVQFALAAPRARIGLEPHRIRVLALLHKFASSEDRTSAPIFEAIHLAYEIERLRCPTGLDFDLTNGDLWATIAADAGARFPLPWVRVLVHAFGATPPGAWVELPDGRRGVVLENLSDGCTVLIGGVPTTTRGELRLISAVEIR